MARVPYSRSGHGVSIMEDIRVAIPSQKRIRPAFTVKKLEGQIERTVLGFDQKGKKVSNTVKVDAGYLVSFPKGHSIRVLTDEAMHRLGFDRSIPLVDLENDGMVVGEIDNPVMA